VASLLSLELETTEIFQMSYTTVFIVLFVLVASIVATVVLLSLFDEKDTPSEQAQADVEQLLLHVNQEVAKSRRVRAGAPNSTA
jgi:NhaP-type Na+/H+ or K+/H+ antiporter